MWPTDPSDSREYFEALRAREGREAIAALKASPVLRGLVEYVNSVAREAGLPEGYTIELEITPVLHNPGDADARP